MAEERGAANCDGSPSREAFDGDYVSQRESTNPGTYFYVWHAEKTLRVLEAMEYPRAKQSATNPPNQHTCIGNQNNDCNNSQLERRKE
jgi:hypothetical protein